MLMSSSEMLYEQTVLLVLAMLHKATGARPQRHYGAICSYQHAPGVPLAYVSSFGTALLRLSDDSDHCVVLLGSKMGLAVLVPLRACKKHLQDSKLDLVVSLDQ